MFFFKVYYLHIYNYYYLYIIKKQITNETGISKINNKIKINDNKTIVFLPTNKDREFLLTCLESFDNQNPNAEWGGIYGFDYIQSICSFSSVGSFRWGEKGVDNPCGEFLSFNPNSIYTRNIKTYIAFHTHASGICEEKGKAWEQKPSSNDMLNAQIWNRKNVQTIVFGMRDKMVYFYNSEIIFGSMSFDKFKTIQ